ncbi:pimeloyl-ACP methyl ester carboxylesterase [Kitasatospora sp. MAP12-15]|uniref:alpha/beta fold hydrolase n=1 Tax=unclassified Kitasatospora TaxID=2633591 RepID=UPI0024768144|nr:alpha/beta hydrolase [Kitasatospora sp. MAP12-44]MDH6110965.1 pimeloyl-ACP methyl ester carboxylesterase [Kitasatospora sp. MAP12-44]
MAEPAGSAGPAGVSRAGLIGISVGVVAAGAAAGVAIERLTVGRATRRRAREELDATAPFGTLRGRPRTVAAADGTELYVELDGPEPAADALTVVFCHGYCLNQDSWHFQRAALRAGLRLVFWDQRSHGRSERSRSYLAGEPASIDQLGADLGAVLDAVVPTGPIVLVGHSMGGMTVMALADQRPELFRERVAGVALIGTTAGDWDTVTLGLPAMGARVWRRLAPGVLKALGSQVGLVEATRRIGADVAAVLYRRFSFGAKDVDPAVARFAEQLLDSTPIDVVAEFYPAFGAHEKATALNALAGLPALVLAGTKDLLTPAAHSEAIAEALPGAELVILQDAGHLVMLECPDEVDHRLAALLRRAAAHAGAAPLPASVQRLAARD